MLAYSGTFTGNGTAGHAVTGVGFQPDMVMIKIGLDGSADTWFRTKDMPAGVALPVRSDGAGSSGYITSLDTDGFTVGVNTPTNQTGYKMYFLALKDDGAGDFSTVTFLGDATDDKLVFTSWQPDYTFLKTDFGIVGARKFSGMISGTANQSSNIAMPNYQGAGPRTDLIYHGVDGMRVSDGSNSGGNLVNQNAANTYGFVMKNSANVKVGSYTGTGTSGATVSTTFKPIWADIHSNSGGNPVILYNDEESAGLTSAYDGAPTTGKISSTSATGLTLSADSSVNGASTTYWYVAIGMKATASSQTPRVVQSVKYTDDAGGTSTSTSLTLQAPPTVGNLLLYFGSFDLNKTYVGNPTGWTAIGTNAYTNGRAAMSAIYRVVQSGDGASWTFPQITTADTETGVLIEVAGQATTGFINGFIKSGSSTAVTTNTSGSVTPTVLNTLAIGFFAEDTGASGTATTDAATITSGWYFDQRPYANFHSSWAAHRTALTSDTTTAIQATVSGTSSSANSSIIVLIAPFVSGGGPITPRTLAMMGIGI